MIPYGHQTINKKDKVAVVKVLGSGWLTQGPIVIKFEDVLAKYCGAKYAVVCSSGTAALHLAYLAAGLKKGDEVITTPNTFVATTNMLLAVGAKPVFCDIRLDTYNIDETKIEKLVTKKTRAIVPVHFAGHPCEMDKIFKMARKYKLLVIEDAAHALGASYKGKKIGGLRSDMTIFSFHPVKPITTGEGGAIVTNSVKFYEGMKLFRSHGIKKDKKGVNVMTELGYNYRLTDIQAALGISQIRKIDSFIKRRRTIVGWYKDALSNVNQIILPQEVEGSHSGWHMYIIRIKNSKLRNKFSEYLKANGIGSNFHYPAVYSHPFYRNNGFKNFGLENEEAYHKSTVTIPCFPALKKSDIEYVAKVIKVFFQII